MLRVRYNAVVAQVEPRVDHGGIDRQVVDDAGAVREWSAPAGESEFRRGCVCVVWGDGRDPGRMGTMPFKFSHEL